MLRPYTGQAPGRMYYITTSTTMSYICRSD